MQLLSASSQLICSVMMKGLPLGYWLVSHMKPLYNPKPSLPSQLLGSGFGGGSFGSGGVGGVGVEQPLATMFVCA